MMADAINRYFHQSPSPCGISTKYTIHAQLLQYDYNIYMCEFDTSPTMTKACLETHGNWGHGGTKTRVG